MRWIISYSKDIAVDSSQVKARRDYIQCLTGTEVTDWSSIRVNGQVCKEYLYCLSNDEIDGTFITAHIDDVHKLCSLKEIYSGKFVVANTCIWKKFSDKELLNNMRRINRDIELWFAKQELSVDGNRNLRQTTTLNNYGRFGFQTSLSERELFMNRGKGLINAIQISFVRVSPIILSED